MNDLLPAAGLGFFIAFAGHAVGATYAESVIVALIAGVALAWGLSR